MARKLLTVKLGCVKRKILLYVLLAMELIVVNVVLLARCMERCSGLTGRFGVQGVANRNGRRHVAVQSLRNLGT